MRSIKNISKRALALLISALMIISVLPVGIFAVIAAGETALTTNITEKTFVTEQETEFSFTTAGGSAAGEVVVGSFTLLDESGSDARTAVQKLEYWDVTGNCYREFYGDFGPATGFPLTDATSNFRVIFSKAGTYTVKAAMVRPGDRSVVVAAQDSVITVLSGKAELTTDIDTKTFVNNTEVEFTYTTKANAMAGTMVLGTFSVLDSEGVDAQSCIKKLEYWDVTGNCYREFYGDFGPAATGFPLTDATSKFRVTFSKVGTYTVNAAMKKFDGGEFLCTNVQTINVEANKATLATDIDTKTIVNRTEVEFTYTTTANDFAGTMVLGTFSVLDSEGVDAQNCIEKLEYWDVTGNCYREFYGDFGPAATGFPLTDATSKFRVTFAKLGTYTVNAAMKKFDGGEVLCTNVQTINVQPYNADLKTDINTKTFVNKNEVEFTYTTTANDYAGTMVLGTFSVLDSEGVDAQSCIEKLEYWDVTGNCYREFYGDFGPAATGFPLTDATSKFRVTFAKPGTYTINAAMKRFDNGDVLCTNVQSITVAPRPSVLTTDITEKTFEINETVEYTYTTVANDFAGVMVVGRFTLQKGGVDVSADDLVLEYWDVTGNCYREFYGDFGPATGFPLTDATSKFRVSFKNTGEYDVVVQMVAVADGTVLSQNEATIEVKDTKAPVISAIQGNATDWTDSDVVLEVIASDNSRHAIQYRISGRTEWQNDNKFTVTENGTYTIKVQDEAGNIADETVEVTRIDKSAPIDLSVSYKETSWKTILGKLFGFKNSAVKVSVTAKDEISGIDFIEYSVDGSNTVKYDFPENGKEASYEFEIEPQYRGKIAFKATDMVGHATEYIDAEDRTVIVDSSNPVVDVKYTFEENRFEEVNDIYYTQNKVTVEFIVTEANFDLSKEVADDETEAPLPVVTVNGTAKSVTWEKVAETSDQWSGTLVLEGNGDYVVKFAYSDRAENAVSWEKEIRIDNVKPELAISYDNNEAANERFYRGKRVATVKITEHNFDPEAVSMIVTAKDINGNNVDGYHTVTDPEGNAYITEFFQAAKTADSWKYMNAAGELVSDPAEAVNSDEHYLVLPEFITEANYALRLTCTDVAKNEAAPCTSEFVLDNTAPGQIAVSYGQDNLVTSLEEKRLVDTLMEIFTLGFYKPEVLVTVSATDAISGIDYFTLDVKNTGLAEATNVELPEEGFVIAADGSFDAEKSGFIKAVTVEPEISKDKVKISFKVPEQFRGEIVVKSVTDYSTNASATFDDKEEIIVDTVSPQVSVAIDDKSHFVKTIEADVPDQKPTRQDKANADEATRYIYNGAFSAKITVKEANFYENDVKIIVMKDGAEVSEFAIPEWIRTGDTYEFTRTVTFTEDGDYQIKLVYSDKTENDMEYTGEYGQKGTKEYLSNVHTIDTTKPVYSFDIYEETDVKKEVGERDYLNQLKTGKITVTDRNFRPNEVAITVKAQDVNGTNVEQYVLKNLKSWGEWTAVEGKEHTWTADVPFDVEANYTVEFSYTDIASNKIENDFYKEFTMDITKPGDVVVSYGPDNLVKPAEEERLIDTLLQMFTLGYYKPEVKVTVSATDITAGIDFFTLNVKSAGLAEATDVVLPEENLIIQEDGSFDIEKSGFIKAITVDPETGKDKVEFSFMVPAQFRGEFIVTSVTDYSTNASDEYNDLNEIIVDTIAPNVSVAIEGSLKEMIDVDVPEQKPTRQKKEAADEATRYIYNGAFTATITVKEANFYDEMDVVVLKDGVKLTEFEISDWEQVGNTFEFKRTIKLTEDGDYQIKLDYSDRTENGMEYTGEYGQTGVKEYVSNVHTIDTTKPVYSFDIYEEADVKNKVGERDYLNQLKTGKITVTDRNFRPNEVALTVEAVDINGDTVYTSPDLKTWDAWEAVEGKNHTWISKELFGVEANYKVDFTYTDIAGNKIENDFHKEFTMDTIAPAGVNIEYESTSLIDTVLQMVTFGYYKPDVKVTVSATDITAGIDFFTLNVKSAGLAEATDVVLPEENLIIQEDGSFDIEKSGFIKAITVNPETGKDKVEFSFMVPAQFRGEFIVTSVTDYSTNASDEYDDLNEIIVDTIAPNVSVVFDGDLKRMIDIDFPGQRPTRQKKEAADEETRYIYNGAFTATITVKEANFYDEMDVVVLKDGVELTEFEISDWEQVGNTFEFKRTIKLTEDGDYQIKLDYSDRTENGMEYTGEYGQKGTKEYLSNVHTIDTTAPVTSVVFDDFEQNGSIRRDEKTQIDYYDTNRTALIAVDEINFVPADIDVLVTAKDSAGKNNIQGYSYGDDGYVEEFRSYAKDADNWKYMNKDGEFVSDPDDAENTAIYYLALPAFAIDANYTFDIRYVDPAENEAVYKAVPMDEDGTTVSDYQLQKFTIDRVNPGNLTVTYDGDVKTTILDQVLNVLTFGYYDAKVKVSITADDAVAGIDYFIYSYIKGADVSGVNASLENVLIPEEEISQNGHTFTGIFEIPKDVLQNTNQFNGTVEFKAIDRATHETEHKETATIIVDNIAPTATISYNAPVQQVGNVSYYNGNINATIVVNEANFNSEGVVVRVNGNVTNVHWTDNSVDVHTGTFTLAADGDYVVTVNYNDRSMNTMVPYTSNQLTIDTQDPVINVSSVNHQSANNEETISFTVTVTDTNIALESFLPVLKAVIKKDNGNNSYSYETIDIPLGNATTTTNANGDTVYSYTITNLEVDGFYSLVCTAVDYANHSVSLINSATDEGAAATVDTVNFSVNREGSVFWIETEHTDKYSGETLKDQLDGAYANDKVVVKLHEINVDKIDESAEKKTVFTLNDGSESKDIELKEGKNYSKNVIVGTGGWYETVYTLDNDNFASDGIYSLNVITYDKAENSNVNTKAKEGTISFTLDRTNPEISTNVKTDQSVKAAEFWVEFEITDVNLNEETVEVKLRDNDDNAVKTQVEELGNNEYKFLVESGYNYSFEVVAKDLAGNTSDLYEVEHFTVSTNIFILWYANTPVFWVTIGGALGLAGLVVLLIVLKNRKKNEAK